MIHTRWSSWRAEAPCSQNNPPAATGGKLFIRILIMTSDQVPEKPYFIPGHFDLLVNRHERELDFYIAQLSCLLDQRKKLDEEIASVSFDLANLQGQD